MRNKGKIYLDREAMRCFSSVFTRSVFKDIILYKDFSVLNSYIEEFNLPFDASNSYANFFKFVYNKLQKHYPSEYVYKNEFLSRLLINKFGTSRTVAFSEFHVGNSIVDLALFNGESKAFEIKTEYDTPVRLSSQLKDYSSVFNKCYIIIPEQLNSTYVDLVGEEIGILNFKRTCRSVDIFTIREARQNKFFDYDIFMQTLHKKEYENIVIKYFKSLPKVSAFQMYDVCKELIRMIPPHLLRKEFNDAVKRRKNNTSLLKNVPRELRQIALAMHLSQKEISILSELIQTPVSVKN